MLRSEAARNEHMAQLMITALFFSQSLVGGSACGDGPTDCTSCMAYGLIDGLEGTCVWCEDQQECQVLLSLQKCSNKVRKSTECPAPPAPPAVDSVASWMSHSLEYIGEKTLFEITMPGSHDTLAYDLTAAASEHEECPQIPEEVRHIPFVGDKPRAMAMTHKLNLKQQLDSGVRHIDFRTIEHEGKWKGVHCLVTYNEISVYLRELAEWLAAHPKELIVMVVTKHGNANAEWEAGLNLQNLLNHFTSALGSLIIKAKDNPPKTTKINTYIQLKQRVLIYMQAASSVEPGGTLMMDAKQNDHMYAFPDGIIKPEGYVKWLRSYGDQNKHGQDRWNDVPLFTSSPTDVAFFVQNILGNPCPVPFDYLDEWCPPTLQDIASLTNYYSQRVLEEWYVKGSRKLPNSIMFDLIDHEGTIRTGHDCISGCERYGDMRLRKAKYAMTATIALLNVPLTATGPWVDAMKQQRARFPNDSWCYPKYGRCPDGQFPNKGSPGCSGGCEVWTPPTAADLMKMGLVTGSTSPTSTSMIKFLLGMSFLLSTIA